jgi:predicted phosphodiesterase
MKTIFIMGNHEEHVLKTAGVDMDDLIARQRDDMVYMGRMMASVRLGGLDFMLSHYTGSNAYSLSYRAQKFLREKKYTPDFALLGHKHSIMYAKIGTTHAFECGTFQRANDFTLSNNFDEQIAGWMIHIKKLQDGYKMNMELLDFT